MLPTSPAFQYVLPSSTTVRVKPQSSIIPGAPDPLASFAQKEGIKLPVQQRMSRAYDKLLMEAEEKAGALSPKSIRTLGKLVLEFEQVNNNLSQIQKEIRADIRAKKAYFDQEKKLFKKEEDELKSIRGAFFGLRAKLGAFSALLAGKAFMEGRYGDAFQNASVAVGSFLPEIINITSSVVLGGLAVKGVAGAGAGAIARSGARVAPTVDSPRMGGRAGMLGLAGAGALAYTAGRSGGAEERRQSLVAREIGGDATISAEDVDRFSSILNRFDTIVRSMLPAGVGGADEEVRQFEDTAGGDGNPPPPPPRPPLPVTQFSEDKMTAIAQASGIIGLEPHELAGIIAAESGGDPQRSNPFGRVGLIQMGPTETASFGVKFEDYKKMTFNQQLDLVVKYFKQRGFQPGMGAEKAYRTVHGGNPNARTVDASGVDTIEYFNRKVAPMIKGYAGKFANIKPPATQTVQPPGIIVPPPEPTPQGDQSVIRTEPGSSNIASIQIPGQTTQVSPKPPKQVSSPDVNFDPEYQGQDKFASNLILGAFA
jgi:hypothetical protein